MISKRVTGRKDGKSSAADSLRYGEGLKAVRETGEILDKSHRTRLGNFGLVDDGVYSGRDVSVMSEVIALAALEMQSNCDLNTRVGPEKKLAHFVVSYNQDRPSDAVLRDTEDSMLAAMKLDRNHFATFLHNDNGYWHLHMFASRIEKDKPHRGNPLWHDKINRDKVCRELETRHGLRPDNGMHQVNEHGLVVEIPRAERQARRDTKPTGITDRAKTTEIYSGEKSFQTWCSEIRIGDRLKHAKTWQDLHVAAAAYNCEIKAKGNGFILCPVGNTGALQLSKVGLKNLPARFGAFEIAKPGHQVPLENAYKAAPSEANAESHYAKWGAAKEAFKRVQTDRMNALRELHKLARTEIRVQQKAELAMIRAETPAGDKFSAISIAKMRHTVALAALVEQHAGERQALRKQTANEGPGNTFRDYLVSEAAKGDNIALGLARKYGISESTDVLRMREVDQLRIVAAVRGDDYRPAPRLSFAHSVERNGTVVYDFGNGRKMTDSAISKQVQLNPPAANSPEAIATALSFATKKFGNTLTLTGSQEFQRLAVETAVINRLGIKFADPALESYRENFASKQQFEKEKYYAPNIGNQFATKIPPAHLRNRMLELPAGDMVLDTSRDVGALRENVYDCLEQHQKGINNGMQRTATSASRAGAFEDKSRGFSGTDSHASNFGIVRAPGSRGRVGEFNEQPRIPVAGLESPNKMNQPAQYTAKQRKTLPPVPAPPIMKEEGNGDAQVKLLSDELRREGKEVRQSLDGISFVGRVTKITDDGRFAVQKVDRSAYVIHDLKRLHGSYNVGQDVEIKYHDGQGRDNLQGLEPQHLGHGR